MLDGPRLVYLVENGHEEGGRLARAGLRARHHVPASEHYRDRVLLHRGRLVVACECYVRTHYFRQVNLLELLTMVFVSELIEIIVTGLHDDKKCVWLPMTT